MKTDEIIKNSMNITVAITMNDLQAILKEAIENTKRELEEAIVSDKMETYPSPKQVCQILDISRSTLFRWERKGYLLPLEIGGRRKYKMSSIKSLMNGGLLK